jgi:hypothetical protein
MNPYGMKTPKVVADLCYLIAVVTALAGLLVGIAVGNGTKAPESGSLISDTPTMVTNWPAGAGIIVAGVIGAFGWVVVGVFFNWLGAMYEAVAGRGEDA